MERGAGTCCYVAVWPFVESFMRSMGCLDECSFHDARMQRGLLKPSIKLSDNGQK